MLAFDLWPASRFRFWPSKGKSLCILSLSGRLKNVIMYWGYGSHVDLTQQSKEVAGKVISTANLLLNTNVALRQNATHLLML